ncbi:MAG: type VI secretion system baseplate subunit TssE [Desulfatitalea sp.]|nr:type VI secretion system baseplate subunit TssE [Desulfatitalea sp.]
MALNKQHLQLSVFDRLDQEAAFGIIGGALADVEVVRKSVLRDVENLLNTRRCIVKPTESQLYLNRSLFVYGLDDFVAQNPTSAQVQKLLEVTIRDTIEKFEPRLKNVQVAFRPIDDYEHNLCFTVRATLHADPIREPIFFDTWFSASRGEYRI